MPILLLFVFAAIGLGLYSPCGLGGCPLFGGGDDTLVAAAPADPRPWQVRCLSRFDAARSEAADAGNFPEFARGELLHNETTGGVWYRIERDGLRYSAGISGVQEGDIPDVDWYSLNGAAEPTGAQAPSGRFSLWRDQGGRSGFVAGLDGDPIRRAAFELVFQRAVDDCMEMSQ